MARFVLQMAAGKGEGGEARGREEAVECNIEVRRLARQLALRFLVEHANALHPSAHSIPSTGAGAGGDRQETRTDCGGGSAGGGGGSSSSSRGKVRLPVVSSALLLQRALAGGYSTNADQEMLNAPSSAASSSETKQAGGGSGALVEEGRLLRELLARLSNNQ